MTPEAMGERRWWNWERRAGPATRREIVSENAAHLLADDAVEILHVNLVEERSDARKVADAVGGLVVKVERSLVDILFMHDIVG